MPLSLTYLSIVNAPVPLTPAHRAPWSLTASASEMMPIDGVASEARNAAFGVSKPTFTVWSSTTSVPVDPAR